MTLQQTGITTAASVDKFIGEQIQFKSNRTKTISWLYGSNNNRTVTDKTVADRLHILKMLTSTNNFFPNYSETDAVKYLAEKSKSSASKQHLYIYRLSSVSGYITVSGLSKRVVSSNDTKTNTVITYCKHVRCKIEQSGALSINNFAYDSIDEFDSYIKLFFSEI